MILRTIWWARGVGPRRRRAGAPLFVLGASLLVAGCGTGSDVITVSATQTPVGSLEITPATDPPATSTTAPVDTTTTEPPAIPTTTEPPIIEPKLFASIEIGEVADIGESKPTRDYDDFIGVAFTDIERWWAEQFPAVYGSEFVPLSGGVYAGYPGRESPIPGCGQEETEYADLQMFVAFYCTDGDFMAYDDGDRVGDDGSGSILAPLAVEYGSAVMGVVLAHEYGHVIQQRIGALDRFLATIITEQQADCFAGAWTGQAFDGDSPLLQLGDRDVRAGLLAMLSVRDPVGTYQFDAGGHGSAFDRVGAFQEGFLNGAERCAELLDSPLTLVPNQFRNRIDALRGGNASYDCRDDPNPDCRPGPGLLADDLNHFWNTQLDTGFGPLSATPLDDLQQAPCTDPIESLAWVTTCPSTRTVYFDEPEVRDLYFEFGDFTIGYLYGVAWAEMVQYDAGIDSTGEQRALLNDCFAGAWVRDITPDEDGRTPRGNRDEDGDQRIDGIVSSPGDLDEAIQMAIVVGDEGANVDRVGSPFEKIDAFRAGVLGGLPACAELGN